MNDPDRTDHPSSPPSLVGDTGTDDRAGSVARRTFLGRSAALGGAAMITPAALVGCGSEDSAGQVTGGDDYTPGSADLQVEIAPEIDGILYPDDYVGPRARELEPFGDGTIDFTILSQTDPELDLATNYYSTLLEQTTGVKASYVTVPAGEDGKTKVNAIVAGGELPHALMVGQDIFNPSEISIYGQQGLFIPLDKLIDENAPHILDMFDSFPNMRQQYTAPDGKLYGVPSMNDCYHCKSANVRTWINQDWLKGIGASSPETLEEYVSVMDEFRAFSGRPDASVLTTADADTMLQLFQFFLGSFLEIPDLWLRRTGSTLEWHHRDPAFRAGIVWIQEQFAAGNFDPGIFSNTAEQYQKLGDGPDGPRFGVGYGYSTYQFSAAADYTDPDSAALIMTPLAPMAGPDGVRTAQWDHFSYGYLNYVITPECPDPVQLIRWADYQFELGLTISGGRGEQGVGWDFASEGQMGIDGQQAVYEVLPTPEDLKNTAWREWGPLYKSMSQRHGEVVQESNPSVEPILFRAAELYEPFATPEESGVPPLVLDMDQSAQIGEITTNLESHLKQAMAAFGTGAKDASDDADWDEYIATASSIGIDTYTEIHQAAYDAQNG
ncbi:hypothetical protein [Brachybacterium sp. FME24]|uniref:hypothetical protein n=1 Tax=Brachybacterium sp. FME24 TaxID=2742605 RepID=UPI0018670444|nr:hypothetical protein [Brachybacterium sp. FME24]